MAKTKCEYGGGCIYCLYVDTCNHPAKERTDGIIQYGDVTVLIDRDKLRGYTNALQITFAEIERVTGMAPSTLSARAGSGTSFDIELAEQIAHRAGTTLENILSDEQRETVAEFNAGVVKQRLERTGKTYGEASTAIGKSRSYVSSLVRGNFVPDKAALDDLCAYLDLNPANVYELQVIG